MVLFFSLIFRFVEAGNWGLHDIHCLHYCFQLLFHDLKMIIFYQGHVQLIFTRVTVLWQFFNSKSCLCNSSCSFQWILVKPSSHCCHDEEDHIIPRSRLTAFYQSYGPLSVLAIYQQKFLSPQLLLHFQRDINDTFQLLFP